MANLDCADSPGQRQSNVVGVMHKYCADPNPTLVNGGYQYFQQFTVLFFLLSNTISDELALLNCAA